MKRHRRVADETDDIGHAGAEIYSTRNHGFWEEHRRDAGERARDLRAETRHQERRRHVVARGIRRFGVDF